MLFIDRSSGLSIVGNINFKTLSLKDRSNEILHKCIIVNDKSKVTAT